MSASGPSITERIKQAFGLPSQVRHGFVLLWAVSPAYRRHSCRSAHPQHSLLLAMPPLLLRPSCPFAAEHTQAHQDPRPGSGLAAAGLVPRSAAVAAGSRAPMPAARACMEGSAQVAPAAGSVRSRVAPITCLHYCMHACSLPFRRDACLTFTHSTMLQRSAPRRLRWASLKWHTTRAWGRTASSAGASSSSKHQGAATLGQPTSAAPPPAVPQRRAASSDLARRAMSGANPLPAVQHAA